MSGTLVIGYGSPLRRDDAAGPLLAERVAAWGRPDVRALTVHQLTPELAEPMSQARRVVFADATAEAPDGPVKATRLHPAAGDIASGHSSDPNWLMGLCQALYGRCPEAWLVTIPAADLGLGEGLSAAAAAGVEEALRLIEGMITEGAARA
jgi:hydrogenase maturation protease